MPRRPLVLASHALDAKFMFGPTDHSLASDICAQTVDGVADAVIVPKGGPQRDPRAALTATYAREIMKRFSAQPISSTEGGAFRSLADAMYAVAFGEEANAILERYVKREVKFLKEQAKKYGK